MTYYAFVKGAEQIVNWKRYRNLRSQPESTDPYPYDGPMWRKDVFESLAAEINLIGAALGEAPISGADVNIVNHSVHKDDANWLAGATPLSDELKTLLEKAAEMTANVYQDPDTGEYYLLVLNVYKDVTAAFTLDLPEEITTAIPVDGSDPIAITDGVFSDHFVPFEATVYQLEILSKAVDEP